MPFYNENQLKKHIRDGNLARLYLIYGDEAYLKNHYAGTLAQNAVAKGFESFNLHKLDGDSGRQKNDIEKLLADVFEICSTVPMMGGYNCVLAKDFPLDSLSAGGFKLFEDGLKTIPDTSVLIFHMDKLEFTAKKNEKWHNILGAVSGYGVCAELNKRSTASMASLIISGAKKRGSEIDADTAEYLISYSGDDMHSILNELDKLCAFASGEKITKETIDMVATKSFEASVFDLTKNIVNKNADGAYAILKTLFMQKTEPVMILGTLASSYVDIYRAKTAEDENRRLVELSNLFNYSGKAFRLDAAARNAKNMTREQVMLCIEFLSAADIGIKFSSKPDKLILEELTAKLLNV